MYACHVHPSAYLVRDDGRVYDRSDYYSNPARYRSLFADKVSFSGLLRSES